MDPMSILFPVLSVGGMGVVFGACLGVASEVFKVEEDPRIGQVLECLPGANCGGCGFPGCGGCASAIVAGTAPVNACPVGGAAVAEKVGAIMGVAASSAEPVAAFVKCGGTCDKAKNKYDYFRNISTNCTKDAISRMNAMLYRNVMFRGTRIRLYTNHAAAAARAITKITAMPMPAAVSTFLETPRKGQIPKNWDIT